MPSFKVEANFVVECQACGSDLMAEATDTETAYGIVVSVETCDRCMEKEYDRGIEDAKEG